MACRQLRVTDRHLAGGAANLWFSDAIYGMRGTTGGAFIQLYPDSAGWRLVLEPVYSDFPSESSQWPEAPEILVVRWTALPSALASLSPPEPRPDTTQNTPEVIGDSLTLVVACDTTRLIRWDHRRRVDTLLLERRRNRGWPE